MADNAASSLNPDVVYVSDLNRVGTRLPDALLDDHTVSPLAKMAYWYLKRHGGRTSIRDLAFATENCTDVMWRCLSDLNRHRWITVAKDAWASGNSTPIQFTVHEVPAVSEQSEHELTLRTAVIHVPVWAAERIKALNDWKLYLGLLGTDDFTEAITSADVTEEVGRASFSNLYELGVVFGTPGSYRTPVDNPWDDAPLSMDR